jgi:toxin FitB
MLLDSNIIIYAIQPEFQRLRNWINEHQITLSAINLVEVLGYHRLTAADKQDFEELFSCATVYPVSQENIETAIDLRQQRKMSLGDALIAATALEHHQTLATRNTSDFNWVEELNVLNPFELE